MPGFCRDCLETAVATQTRCGACGSPRLLQHDEIDTLSIAHIDCDAFYAAVEKRDNPELNDKPLIIGGGRRGVVSTACYIARIRGVRSAMPMFKALKACPEAIVLPPDMAKYATVGRQVREMMRELTPLVEPLSIDEAFLDLSGTERLHGNIAAKSLALLTKRIETELRITVSVGLSHNKFLAKIASDLQKPRGFSLIGKKETADFLADKKVSIIWGVGKAMQRSLAKHGITDIAQLRRMERNELLRHFGTMGARLYHLARGEDAREVTPVSPTKSISSETTFSDDIRNLDELERTLWRLCEKVSQRAKNSHLGGLTVTLKLKTADFSTRTRAASLAMPTQLADRVFAAAKPLLQREADGTAFRLIGVGLSHLEEMHEAESYDLDERAGQRAKAELAMDDVRARFGRHAVDKGRGLRRPRE